MEQQLPVTSTTRGDGKVVLPPPSLSPEAVEATWQVVQERAPFPARFIEALRDFTA
jgi:hypothetical protein